MKRRGVHWRYVYNELTYRWKRTALLIGGVALSVALVSVLGIVGRAFAELATMPFRNLGADLIVQRSATESAVPKEMGIILPYSAEPITNDELRRLSTEPGVTQAAGFVLLWNLGKGSFISISGIPLDANAPDLGPGKVRSWIIAGRLPVPGKPEVLVERHYGAFFRLKPGSHVDIGGAPFTVVGVVDIKEGSQIVASNFYMDIDAARRLARLPNGLVNQVFLKLSDMGQTEKVESHIASWLPRASITSPGTMLQLFGGISQIVGRFRVVVVTAGALAALTLSAMLVFGNLIERRRELALLRTFGWEERDVRREVTAELAVQGLLGGIVGAVILVATSSVLAHVGVPMPSNVPGENPVMFANGYQAAAGKVALPISLTSLDWSAGPIVASIVLAAQGWLMSHDPRKHTLWATIKET